MKAREVISSLMGLFPIADDTNHNNGFDKVKSNQEKPNRNRKIAFISEKFNKALDFLKDEPVSPNLENFGRATRFFLEMFSHSQKEDFKSEVVRKFLDGFNDSRHGSVKGGPRLTLKVAETENKSN